MAVISLVGVMPAAFVADHLGRKWTIVPSCLGLALSLIAMAMTGEHDILIRCQVPGIVPKKLCGAAPLGVTDMGGGLQAAWRAS